MSRLLTAERAVYSNSPHAILITGIGIVVRCDTVTGEVAMGAWWNCLGNILHTGDCGWADS